MFWNKSRNISHREEWLMWGDMAEKMGCYKESSRADKCIDRLCELNGNEDVRIEGGKKPTRPVEGERVICWVSTKDRRYRLGLMGAACQSLSVCVCACMLSIRQASFGVIWVTPTAHNRVNETLHACMRFKPNSAPFPVDCSCLLRRLSRNKWEGK